MHKDEWSRKIILYISSAPECGTFCEKPGWAQWVPVPVLLNTRGIRLFISGVCASPVCAGVDTRISCWGIQVSSHKRGCAEAPLSLWIRAEDLLSPISLDLTQQTLTALLSRRAVPSLGSTWTPVSEEYTSLKVFLMPDWAHFVLHVVGLCVPIPTWELHTEHGDLPRYQELLVLGNISCDTELFSELKGMTPNSASCSFL